MRNRFVAGVLSFGLSFVPLLATNTVAIAEDAKADIGFCLKDEGAIDLTALTKNELGVVVTNVGSSATNPKGQVVVSANNYFGKADVGPFFKSGMGVHKLPGGNCYNLAIMTKQTPPDAAGKWSCVAADPNMIGKILTFSAGVVSGQVVGVTDASATAPILNCPPPAK